MIEEKLKCFCGCGAETSTKMTLEYIFEILQNHKEGLYVIGKTCEFLTNESDKKKEVPDNSKIIIESICADIKSINDRLDKLEEKQNPQVAYDKETGWYKPIICSDKDVKPV